MTTKKEQKSEKTGITAEEVELLVKLGKQISFKSSYQAALSKLSQGQELRQREILLLRDIITALKDITNG